MTIPNSIEQSQLPESVLQQITSRIERGITEKVFPAATVCVFQDDEQILNGAWGYLDPEKGEPVQTNTFFDLASLTKLFTATAFLSFVADGKVTLDIPLVDIVPEFGIVNPRLINGGQHPFTKEFLPVEAEFVGQTVDPTRVTFRYLLTHTSGLPPWRSVYELNPVPAAPDEDDPVFREERWAKALDALCNYEFVGQPGSDIRYSDVGFLLLGEAVTRLSDYDDLYGAIWAGYLVPADLGLIVFAQIFDDISVAPTELDKDWRKRRVIKEVHDENSCSVGGVAGHAGLFARAEQVAQFGQWWLSNVRDGHEPFASAMIEHAADKDNRRGLGWMLKDWNSSSGSKFGENSFGHTGFTGTSLWVDPDAQLVVAVLTNRVYYGRDNAPQTHEFRRDIHDIIHGGLV